MFGVVAATMERARHEIRERSLNPNEAVIVTPRSLDRIRGCRLAFIIWSEGWEDGISFEKATEVVDTVRPALIG